MAYREPTLGRVGIRFWGQLILGPSNGLETAPSGLSRAMKTGESRLNSCRRWGGSPYGIRTRPQ